jgi:DNA-binding CsgD family transcriptional regulator
MSTRTELHAKKDPTKKEPVRYTCEDLIRLLVRQARGPDNSNFSTEQHPSAKNNEEIVLDVDLDGAHYLLIRLPNEDRPRVQLSPREQEIVRMVAKGHSNKIIADVLNIGSWTVCTHLRRIFAKFGVGSRAAMVAKTFEEKRPWQQASGGEKSAMAEESMPSSPRHLLPAESSSDEKTIRASNRSLLKRAS